MIDETREPDSWARLRALAREHGIDADALAKRVAEKLGDRPVRWSEEDVARMVEDERRFGEQER